MKSTYLKHLLIVISVSSLGLNATGSAAAQQVRVVQASPASLMSKTGNQVMPQPKPLSVAQKLLAAQSVVSRQGKKASSLGSPLLLSPTKLTAGTARLSLASPTIVRSMSGVVDALFIEKKAGLNVTFTPPAAGMYLMDFTIGGLGSAAFTLSGSNATQSTAAISNSGHLLFVTDVTTANKEIHFKLEGEGLWSFLSCEISQIK